MSSGPVPQPSIILRLGAYEMNARRVDCFFFSSRRRHTRFSRDWSSDVCSSDLKVLRQLLQADAAIVVIDCREPVLPKYRSEIEVLTGCARPIMPVLNFVRAEGG